MSNHVLLSPLIVAALLIILWALVVGLTRFAFVFGKKWTYADIKPGAPHGPAWYASLNRVLINSTESFALFAPAAVLHITLNTPHTWLGTAGWAYVGARLLYALVYLVRGYTLPVSLVWLVSFGATAAVWAALLMG